MHRIQIKQMIVVVGLISLGILERVWLDLGPNRELITLTSFLGVFYLGRKQGLFIALISMALSDAFLGNTSIALFTWSAYVVSAFIATFFKRLTKTSPEKIAGATLGGVIATFWFFLWTNFGVWLLDSWGIYENNLSGLYASYIGGLPFLRLHLLSNGAFLAAGFTFIEGFNYFIHRYFSLKTVRISS